MLIFIVIQAYMYGAWKIHHPLRSPKFVDTYDYNVFHNLTLLQNIHVGGVTAVAWEDQEILTGGTDGVLQVFKFDP